MNLSHLRADLDLGSPGWREDFGRALALAEALDVLLDVAFSAGDEGVADDEMRQLAGLASARRHRVGRWLVFSRALGPLRPSWWLAARRILGPIDRRIPLVAGTVANFLELNRACLPWEQLDGICFSAHPQEHASDNASLVENLEGLASAVESARRRPGASGRGRADHAPKARESLRDRAGRRPGARGASRGVDPRQMSLFGAAWTLGAIKHLAEQGAARATFYETTGWLGVMEEARPALRSPRGFPRTGQVFPHVPRLRRRERVPRRRGPPEPVDSSPGRRRARAPPGQIGRSCWPTSRRRMPRSRSTAWGAGRGSAGSTRRTHCRMPRRHHRFRAGPGSDHATAGGGYTLALGEYALARLDTE